LQIDLIFLWQVSKWELISQKILSTCCLLISHAIDILKWNKQIKQVIVVI
jgi:hypothetical protein